MKKLLILIKLNDTYQFFFSEKNMWYSTIAIISLLSSECETKILTKQITF